MALVTKLVRTFTVIGFCNGIVISGLVLFFEWRGIHDGTALLVVALALFPAGLPMFEYLYSGKLLEALFLFLLSIVNGGLYTVLGLVVEKAVGSWRRRLVRNRI